MTQTLRLELAQVPPEQTGDGVALLSTPVEFMRYCYECDRETKFVADQVCSTGLVGKCAKCIAVRGEENSPLKIVPFTRTHSDGWNWEVETE